MLADQLDYVVGVDTHRDAHALALIAASTGAGVLEAKVVADRGGYGRALTLARAHGSGTRCWAIEGSGSYGAGLARFFAERGERVVEVGRPQRSERRQGKSGRIDALRAARAALGETRLALPRAGGAREALRALVTTREGAVATRRAALNQLRALIVVAPESLRAELRTLTRAKLLTRCACLRPERHTDPRLRGTALALRACARRAQAATAQERELTCEIVPARAAGAAAARRARSRANLGRTAARLLVTPRPLRRRGCLRPPRRRCADPRLLRPGRPPPARPRRRPGAQPSPPHDRRLAPQAPPGDNRLRTATHRRRQERPRSDPLPQTLPRPPPLPHARGRSNDRLTSTEASPGFVNSAEKRSLSANLPGWTPPGVSSCDRTLTDWLPARGRAA